MNNKNIIKIYTTSNGAELNISAPSVKQVISATNNRAQYFAEQSKKYRDEAKQHRDNAKYYSEQNSDVTFEYINNVRTSLESKIAEKQDIGNYALKEDLPVLVSELENDADYVIKSELNLVVEDLKLPQQEGCYGKFLMSDGEKEVWKSINTFQLFDTKISDSFLDSANSIGWALQGTYVDGAVYPDFYAKCIEEYNEATNTETVNGVTVKVNSNGHKFYDIADKTAIDEFYNSLGLAWFYGIDTENERIFLPRDKYFAVTGDVSVVGNGMTLGLTDGTNFGGLAQATDDSGAMLSLYGTSIGTPRSGSYLKNGSIGITTDPTKSGVEGKLTANEDKYLYICVGNTIVNEDQIDVGQVLSQAVLRSSLEEVQTVIETYQNGTSWYRVWSDGWCEQGGEISWSNNTVTTITFIKTFKDINYHIYSQVFGPNQNANLSVSFSDKTTSSIKMYPYSDSRILNWQASGYIW